MKKERMQKFGGICRVLIDHNDRDVSEPKEPVNKVYRKDKTPNRPDYRDLMDNGGEGWRREHSERNLLEWGTPSDYLGTGTKLLLYDTDARAITVVADIDPDQCFTLSKEENYYNVRNIIRDGSICVLSNEISLDDITKVDGLEKFQNHRQFKDITKTQFEVLIRGKKCRDGRTL